MMTEKQRFAAKATTIRKRLRDGKPISSAEREWIAEYESRVKRGRPRDTTVPRLPPEMPDDAGPDLPPLNVSGDGETVAEVVADPNEGPPREGASNAALPTVSEAGAKLATQYLDMVVKLSEWCVTKGGMGIPPLFLTLMRPSCERVATRALTMLALDNDDTVDEWVDDLVAGVPTAVLGIQAFKLVSKPGEQAAPQSEPVARPHAPSNGANGAAHAEHRPEVRPRHPMPTPGRWKLGRSLGE